MKRLYARLVLWLIRPALELKEGADQAEVTQRIDSIDVKSILRAMAAAKDGAVREIKENLASQPALLDDPEAQSRLIESAMFPWRQASPANNLMDRLHATVSKEPLLMAIFSPVPGKPERD